MNTPQPQNSRNKKSIETNLMSPLDDRNSLIKEQKDVLMGMYCESCTHARHYEDQRATISNIIILATVGLVGFVANGGLTSDDEPLIIAIVLLGACGSVFTTLYYRRISRFGKRADEYLLSLDALVFGWPSEGEKLEPRTLHAILKEADLPQKDKTYAQKSRTPVRRERMALLRMFWPLLISLAALVLASIFMNGPSTDITYKIKTDSAGCVVKIAKD
ncbi:MAG TPA: hypothetical protein VNG71_00425 [Pyrinomonadaceae bacterium]|nr:hypothetical protein [Pyrinomonadaceae bacterium]